MYLHENDGEKVGRMRPRSAPAHREASTISQTSLMQQSPSPQHRRPISAHANRSNLQSTMNSSDLMLRSRPSSAASVRSRDPSVRTPRVYLYRNGQKIDGKGIRCSLSLTMGEILSDASRLLHLPFSAKILFKETGDVIKDLADFVENMNVIVSMGERFKFKVYLPSDDFHSLPRRCKYCFHTYVYSENTASSCLRHTLPYVGGKWLCCGSTNRIARGCGTGYHTDPNFDDDLNAIPRKRYVIAVINGKPFHPDNEVLVDIPSKLEVLLETVSHKLKMVKYATKLYTEKGLPIKTISDIKDGMRVVASLGENFRWGVYLTRDEIMIVPRKCYRCKKVYTGIMNRPDSCVYHSMEYSASVGVSVAFLFTSWCWVSQNQMNRKICVKN
eukprot:TRINITY_DN9940_c0_g1_i1.p1 TRINITY_DN9940_c0_g1~~TRINITY_DN9940_c0_g1_i1.p1  ORF type:complete len:435 (+),score=56.37 TRINITY_DN9940_c0_g1_i1:149-1306(+)